MGVGLRAGPFFLGVGKRCPETKRRSRWGVGSVRSGGTKRAEVRRRRSRGRRPRGVERARRQATAPSAPITVFNYTPYRRAGESKRPGSTRCDNWRGSGEGRPSIRATRCSASSGARQKPREPRPASTIRPSSLVPASGSRSGVVARTAARPGTSGPGRYGPQALPLWLNNARGAPTRPLGWGGLPSSVTVRQALDRRVCQVLLR